MSPATLERAPIQATAQPSSGKRHFPELTLLPVILALLVIYSHATSRALLGYDRESFQYLFIFVTKKLCGCAVPGFLFLSGVRHFLSFKREGFKYGAFLLKKVRRLLPSYVIWVVIYYVYFVRRGYFPFEVGALAEYIALGTLVAHMYFVVVLMQLFILMPLWRGFAGWVTNMPRSGGKTAFLVLILLLSAVIMRLSKAWDFVYADRIFTSFLFYWLLGVICGLYYEDFTAFLRRRRALLIPLELVVVAAHVALSYLASRGRFTYRFAEEAQILFATALLLLVLDLCTLITRRRIPLRRFVQAFDGASYNIYLTHNLVLFMVDEYTPSLGLTANLAVRLVCALVIPAVLCIGYNGLKKKILGGQKLA